MTVEVDPGSISLSIFRSSVSLNVYAIFRLAAILLQVKHKKNKENRIHFECISRMDGMCYMRTAYIHVNN